MPVQALWNQVSPNRVLVLACALLALSVSTSSGTHEGEWRHICAIARYRDDYTRTSSVLYIRMYIHVHVCGSLYQLSVVCGSSGQRAAMWTILLCHTPS